MVEWKRVFGRLSWNLPKVWKTLKVPVTTRLRWPKKSPERIWYFLMLITRVAMKRISGRENSIISSHNVSTLLAFWSSKKKIGWQIQKCCTRQKAIPRTERLYSLIDPRLNSLAVFLSLLGLVEIHACNKWNKITYGHMITQRVSARPNLEGSWTVLMNILIFFGEQKFWFRRRELRTLRERLKN